MTDLRRLYYISDPSSIATNLLPDPVRESDLRSWIDTVADAGVSTFCQEVFSQGWTAYFRSQHPDYEYDQRRQHRRFLPLLDGGVSPLDILIDEAHARGMGFLAGFRINDDHAFQARQQGLDIARFIDANPQFQLTEFPEGEFYRLAEPLDFTHPEVRDFTMRIIAEVVHRFDVDGIELCFRDHGYFPLDQGEARAHLMTDMLRQTRAILNEGSGGRRLTLGVRVFSTIEECLLLGLDVAAWIDAPDRPRQPAGRDVRRPAAAAISPGASTRNLANRSTALRVPSMFRCAAFAATPAWTSSPYASTPPAHVNSAAYTGVSRATRTTSAIGATNSTDLKDYSVA